ncbi:Oidioi.mRNA.OKI2018_I69.chr2.g3959.t1.cds [Oikopleura dioica]|uniref:Oidioi.mRNA.OKI2018_I69.chr2.g3959.t1.cds n=1 Tax=Oikopleura dioica TaxID=34765 RepID=A0ABN7SVG5_OIKDI|nr:Oidioi.mRNA.OKI2018_I69.chr2.g3959.t1.cds [Oikopleura dioica]
MKLGWFLLASFLPENNGQEAAPDLAKLAASFSPEQLAALQSVLGANKIASPTGLENPVAPAATSSVAQPAAPAVPAIPTQQPTTKPTNATTLATEAPAAPARGSATCTRLEGASVDLEQETGRIEDSPEELIPDGPSEDVNPAEDQPLSNFDPLAPISAENPAPQTALPPQDSPLPAETPVELPAEESVAEETVSTDSTPAPLTKENTDLLSLLQGKSPEQIAQLLALAQGPGSTTRVEDLSQGFLHKSPSPAQGNAPAEDPQPEETVVEEPIATETMEATEEEKTPAPVALPEEEPIEAEVENTAAENQSTGFGIQIAQPDEATLDNEETEALEEEKEAQGEEREEPVPEVTPDLFPEGEAGEDNGEEVLNFEGDTPIETEELGENPRIQLPAESQNDKAEEEEPQITEPELEIPAETTQDLEDEEDVLDNEYEEEAGEENDADAYDEYEEYDKYGESYDEEYDGEYDESEYDESESDFWKFNDNDNDDLSDNLIQEEARNGDLFSDHDEEMAEDKAKYNFAFFMILFVFGTTGAYYVFTTAKNKFFPQSNKLFKRHEQSYKLLPKTDTDVKQSASSEDKDEWNNDDW